MMFSKSTNVMDSNETEVRAILEALHRFVGINQSKLIVESNSSNAIAWVSVSLGGPSTFQFILNEIKALSSAIQVEFIHISMANILARQGMDRSFPFVVYHL